MLYGYSIESKIHLYTLWGASIEELRASAQYMYGDYASVIGWTEEPNFGQEGGLVENMDAREILVSDE